MDCEANTFFGLINAFRGLNVFSLLPLARQEYMLMFIVDRQQEEHPGGCTVSTLTRLLRVPQPAVSRTLRSLENNGYVCREVCREDRRNTYVTLTAAGAAEVQKANQLLEKFHRGVQTRFTQEESDQLMELLRRLYTAASEELEEMKGEKQANG